MSATRTVTSQSLVSSRAESSVRPDSSPLRANSAILLVVALFAVIAFIVRPFGNYPIDDGAGYGLSIFGLVREGHLQFPSWAAMTMVTQMVYGAVACILLGPSFTALHVFTLIISLVGIGALYLLAVELGASRSVAALTAASIALNPIYFALSFRFISDIPHFVFIVLGTLLFVKSVHRTQQGNTLGMTALSVLAVMTRQCGMCMPLAFLITNSLRVRSTIGRLLSNALPAVLSLICLLAFDYWRLHTGQTSLNYRSLVDLAGHAPSASLAQSVSRAIRIPLYCGFYMCPLGIALFFGYWRRMKLALVSISVLGLIYAIAICLSIRPMPSCSAVFQASGLGPKAFPIELPELALWIRWFLTWACSVSFLSMLYELLLCLKKQSFNQISAKPMIVYAVCLGGIYFLSVLRLQAFYDKYTLPLALPALLILLANKPFDRINSKVGFITVALFSALTCFCAFNYYAYNAACWDLIRLAIRQGVPPENINAGFEGNLLFSQRAHSSAVNDWYTWCRKADAGLSISSQAAPGYTTVRGVEFPCLFGNPRRMWLSARGPAIARLSADTSMKPLSVAPSSDTHRAELKYFGIDSADQLATDCKWLSPTQGSGASSQKSDQIH